MRVSILTKIVLLFALVIAIFAGVSYYQIRHLSTSTRAFYDLNIGYLPFSKIIAQTDSALKNQQTDINRLVEVEEASIRNAMATFVSQYFPRLVRQNIAQGVAHCKKMLLVTQDEQTQAFYGDMRQQLVALGDLQKQYQAAVSALFEKLNTSEVNTAHKELNEHKHLQVKLERAAKVLTMKMDNEISRIVKRAEAQGDRASWAGILLSIAALIAAIMLTIVSAFLLKPLRRLTEAAQRIGEGEYRYGLTVTSSDELGQLAGEFEKMRRSLIQRDRALTEQTRKLEVSNVELGTLKLHYENIIRNLEMPVLVADVHQRLTTLNPAAARLWGEAVEHMIGEPVADLPLAEARLGDAIPFGRVLEQKVTVVREALKVRRSDEQLRSVTFSVVPFIEENEVRGLLILGEDVTDELRMRESLLQSERMAAIGRVSAKIAHEIRNPLSSISLNAEMLEDELSVATSDPAELRPMLSSISREIDRLHSITENYLKFARMPEAKPEVLDLNRVVQHLVEFYRAEMEKRSLSCNVELEERPVRVRVDENQIVRVIHNLIKNAIDATPSGGRIDLRTSIAGDECEIHVFDNGPGVSADLRQKIFEPFFSTKSQGTGLGLATSQQAVMQMGGRLVFVADDEAGAHFCIGLPRLEDDEVENSV